MGRTPAQIRFEHYGTYEVLLHPARSEGEEIYASVAREVTLRAPWYQWFPLDIFSEYLWPFTIEDIHRVEIFPPTLDPAERMLELRKELESTEPPPEIQSP